MWVCLNDAFLSIVSKDCKPHELLVRARRKGDIEKLFPTAKVVRVDHADYLFRAVVKRTEVAAAMAGEVARVDYPNFKDSVDDDRLHDAYMRVWTAMASLQPRRPGLLPFINRYDTISSLFADDPPPTKKKRKRRARRRHPQTTFMDLG